VKRIGIFWEDAPVFVGYYDKDSGYVERNGRYATLIKVQSEVDSWFHTTSDWAGWFQENGVTAEGLDELGSSWKASDGSSTAWGNVKRERADWANDIVFNRAPKHAASYLVLVGVTLLAPEERLFQYMLEKYGYQIIKVAGQKVLGKVVGKEVVPITEAEA